MTSLRPSGLARLLILSVSASLVGLLAGWAHNHVTAGETPVPFDLLPYTYATDECDEVSLNEKDPINVVFTHHGFAPEITQQAIDHRGWEVQGLTEQFFGDQYRCREMEGSPASNCCSPGGRYHMRHYNHKGPGGERRDTQSWGSISSAAAHHDNAVHFCGFPPVPCCGFPENPNPHAVDRDSTKFTISGEQVYGGFNAGREDIRKNWVTNSDHVLENVLYWDT